MEAELEKVKVLLTHWIHHNAEHKTEFENWAEKIRNWGLKNAYIEVNQAADVIKAAVDPDANIIFGVANNPSMENEVRITLITTGFLAKLGMGKANAEEEELNKILKNMKMP